MSQKHHRIQPIEPNDLYVPREEIENKILTSIQSKENTIVSLCGEGGSGKSTMFSRLKERAKTIDGNVCTLLFVSEHRHQIDYLKQLAYLLREEYPDFKAFAFWTIYATVWNRWNSRRLLKNYANIGFVKEIEHLTGDLSFFENDPTILDYQFIDWIWSKVEDKETYGYDFKKYLYDCVSQKKEKVLSKLLAIDIDRYLKKHGYRKYTLFVDFNGELYDKTIEPAEYFNLSIAWLRQMCNHLEHFSIVISTRHRIDWKEKCGHQPLSKTVSIDLPPFSDKQAKDFLTQAGVTDPAVQELIVADAKGSPLLLSLQAKTYEMASRPNPQAFKAMCQETVFQNYLDCLGDRKKSIVTLLAVPRRLTRALAQTLVEKFVDELDENCLDDVLKPVIFKERNGVYTIDNALREYILSSLPKDFLKNVADAVLVYFESRLAKDLETMKNIDEIENNFIEANYYARMSKDLLAYSDWLNERVLRLMKAGLNGITVEALEALILKLENYNMDTYQKALVTSYSRLALIYDYMDKTYDAHHYFQKAIDQSSKVYGQNHPKTAEIYEFFANLYRSIGNAFEAKALLFKALDIYVKNYTEEHPTVISIYDDIADTYETLENYREAERYLMKGLQLSQKLHGEVSLETALFYNHLGFLYRGLGYFDEGEYYYEKEREIYKKIYKDELPEHLKP